MGAGATWGESRVRCLTVCTWGESRVRCLTCLSPTRVFCIKAGDFPTGLWDGHVSLKPVPTPSSVALSLHRGCRFLGVAYKGLQQVLQRGVALLLLLDARLPQPAQQGNYVLVHAWRPPCPMLQLRKWPPQNNHDEDLRTKRVCACVRVLPVRVCTCVHLCKLAAFAREEQGSSPPPLASSMVRAQQLEQLWHSADGQLTGS